MTTQPKALRIADALEELQREECNEAAAELRRLHEIDNQTHKKLDNSITAIKEALAQPEQEPVIDKSAAIRIATSLGWSPQRTWVGLTDEDFSEACQMAERGNYLVAFQHIQAKLKEKNT